MEQLKASRSEAVDGVHRFLEGRDPDAVMKFNEKLSDAPGVLDDRIDLGIFRAFDVHLENTDKADIEGVKDRGQTLDRQRDPACVALLGSRFEGIHRPFRRTKKLSVAIDGTQAVRVKVIPGRQIDLAGDESNRIGRRIESVHGSAELLNHGQIEGDVVAHAEGANDAARVQQFRDDHPAALHSAQLLLSGSYVVAIKPIAPGYEPPNPPHLPHAPMQGG